MGGMWGGHIKNEPLLTGIPASGDSERIYAEHRERRRAEGPNDITFIDLSSQEARNNVRLI